MNYNCLEQGTNFHHFVWNRVAKLTFFCLEQGQGLRDSAAHPYPKFPGVPPPGLNWPLVTFWKLVNEPFSITCIVISHVISRYGRDSKVSSSFYNSTTITKETNRILGNVAISVFVHRLFTAERSVKKLVSYGSEVSAIIYSVYPRVGLWVLCLLWFSNRLWRTHNLDQYPNPRTCILFNIIRA